MKTSHNDDQAYRRLQQHLDRLPIGFPPTGDGSDIRLLKHVFTPEEARIAACLSHEPRPVDQILDRAVRLVSSRGELVAHLEAMVKKGGLECRCENGQDLYANAPLVVGIYELQFDRLTPEFIRDFQAYTQSKRYGISFLSTKRPQMRTIPINKSITPDLPLAGHDQIMTLLETAEPPFVVVSCICRKKKRILGEPCQQTHREETCMAMGGVAQTLIKMEAGREISRDEAMAIIAKNQEEGLVLQPSNTRKIEFLCSCCPCCCSMLDLHRSLPAPLDFWESPCMTVLDLDLCVGCGKCRDSCGANALTFTQGSGKNKVIPALNSNRCIGCGQCVSACKTGALSLVSRPKSATPPEDRDGLNALFLEHKHPLAQLRAVGTLAKGMVKHRDFRLLKGDS